tara:strand:- start:366 stop:608 length:243 start_codon:yes stop_codon:yes gene_type:complete
MVESYYLTLFSITAVIVVLMAMDPNVATYIDLQFRNVLVQLKRRYYIITMGTVIKFQTWKMKREIKKIRKEYGLPDEESN